MEFKKYFFTRVIEISKSSVFQAIIQKWRYKFPVCFSSLSPREWSWWLKKQNRGNTHTFHSSFVLHFSFTQYYLCHQTLSGWGRSVSICFGTTRVIVWATFACWVQGTINNNNEKGQCDDMTQWKLWGHVAVDPTVNLTLHINYRTGCRLDRKGATTFFFLITQWRWVPPKTKVRAPCLCPCRQWGWRCQLCHKGLQLETFAASINHRELCSAGNSVSVTTPEHTSDSQTAHSTKIMGFGMALFW